MNCVGNKICWEGCSIGVKIGGLSHALNPVSDAYLVYELEQVTEHLKACFLSYKM